MAKLLYLLREVKYLVVAVLLVASVYFISMDVIVYRTLQNTTLVLEEKREIPKLHSPFHPLSVKLLSLDHYSHYIIKPSAEMFNYATDFSNIAHFITPNMISASHVAVGLFAGKFVSSDSLRHRRMGALLYEFRTWLDGLDGVVYRSRSGNNLYKTNGGSLTNIDNICDVIGGVALCVGVLLHIWKQFDKSDTPLPQWTKPKNSVAESEAVPVAPSKRVVFVTVALFGALVAVAGRTWELQVSKAEALFENQLPTQNATMVQTALLHAGSTWWTFWCWKLVGQMLFHYLVIAIILDKTWEFLSFAWSVGGFFVLALNLMSYCHLNHVETLIQMTLQQSRPHVSLV